MPDGWLQETEDQKKFKTYRQLGGKLSFDQWRLAGRPLTPAEEMPYVTPHEEKRREEAERAMRTDEYGAILNYPLEGQVRLPDGKTTTMEWYNKRTSTEKWQYAGYGMATKPLLPGGEGVPPSVGEEEGEPGVDYKVEEHGGFSIWVGRDKEGNIQEYQVVGRTPEAEMEEVEGMTEYERENLALARQRETRLERESQWQMGQQTGESYQEYRQRLLGELTGPGDWIKRWEVAYGGIPGGRRWEPAAQTRAEQGTSEIRQLESLISQKQEAARGAWAANEPDRAKSLTRTVGELQKSLAQSEEDYGTAIQEQQASAQRGQETGIWPEAGGQPKAPGAPQWLSQFVPSQTAGQPITRQWVPTPSPQTWLKTPWSIREGLRGFTEWSAPASRGYRDILEHMGQMIPSAPRGAGVQRFKPRTQWRG